MENKVVVITGGSSGAGEALAYKFSSKGFNIVIGGTNIERLKKVQSNIKSIGTNCEFIVHDVSPFMSLKSRDTEIVDTPQAPASV